MSSNEITFVPSKLFMSFQQFWENKYPKAMKLSKGLENEVQTLYRQFCTDILVKVKQVNPPPAALCTSLVYWSRSSKNAFLFRSHVRLYQAYLFELHGLDCNFPFNPGDVTGESLTYGNEVRLGTLYKNPRRLAWLEKFASPQS